MKSFFNFMNYDMFIKEEERMQNVLRTNNLSKRYGKTFVVDKVNMTIEKGEIYGLIGENGAGKSTIMKMVCGIISPTTGDIELFDNENPSLERFRMGCLIDAPAFYPELSARNNLEIYRRAYGITDGKCVDEVLRQMNLTGARDKLVKKYSLGMKQRLAIGIALLGNPDFLVLDEPMNGLDPTGIQEIRYLLEQLNKERQITILISSHILGELSRISTKYGIIKEGRLIDEISVGELTAKCQHCLKVRVSDVSKAAVILEKELHTTNYEIVDEEVLRIFDYVDNPGHVNSTLIKNNILVIESGIYGETLEDYFNEKIGGTQNA